MTTIRKKAKKRPRVCGCGVLEGKARAALRLGKHFMGQQKMIGQRIFVTGKIYIPLHFFVYLCAILYMLHQILFVFERIRR